MNIFIHYPQYQRAPIWLAPAYYVAAILALQYVLVALYAPPSMVSPFMTWCGPVLVLTPVVAALAVVLLGIYQRLNVAMQSFLLTTRQLSYFCDYRRRAYNRLRNQALLAALLTISMLGMTVLAGQLPPLTRFSLVPYSQLILAAWLGWLVVFQCCNLPRFIAKHFFVSAPDSLDAFSQQQRFTDIIDYLMYVVAGAALLLPLIALYVPGASQLLIALSLLLAILTLYGMSLHLQHARQGEAYKSAELKRLKRKQRYLQQHPDYDARVKQHAQRRLDAQAEALDAWSVPPVSRSLQWVVCLCGLTVPIMWLFSSIQG